VVSDLATRRSIQTGEGGAIPTTTLHSHGVSNMETICHTCDGTGCSPHGPPPGEYRTYRCGSCEGSGVTDDGQDHYTVSIELTIVLEKPSWKVDALQMAKEEILDLFEAGEVCVELKE
jgi:DnaJ-class molecular chaperone